MENNLIPGLHYLPDQRIMISVSNTAVIYKRFERGSYEGL